MAICCGASLILSAFSKSATAVGGNFWPDTVFESPYLAFQTVYFGPRFIRRRTTEPVLVVGNGSLPILDNPGISPTQSPPDRPGDDQNRPSEDDRRVAEHAHLIEQVFDNFIHRQTIADPRNDVCATKYRRIAIHCVLSHDLSSDTEVGSTSGSGHR